MLATQDVWPSSTAHLTNEERLQRFREKAHIIDLQIMSLAQDAAELAATDAWDEDGSATAIDWIRFNGHMTSNAAADLIAVGKNLQRMPESHQAVYQGEIGYAQSRQWPGRLRPWGPSSRKPRCWSRRGRTRRASSITSAATTGTLPPARGLRRRRLSWWRTASSLSAPARTAPCSSAGTSTPKAAPRF